MSRSELGKSSGTNYHRIRKYEKGEQSPNARRLIAMASALGVAPEDLLKEPAGTVPRPRR